MLRLTSFLMISLTSLCDEYIDRPNLSEQKNPFDYIVPPPTSGVGTIINMSVGLTQASLRNLNP